LTDKSRLNYLAQLLEAQIALLEASSRLIAICPHDKSAIEQLIKNLKLCRTLASSIHQAGFYSQLEHVVLKIAEQSGKTTEALHFISSNINKRQKRARELRTRLLLPNTVIFIMLAINIVRSVTAGENISSILIDSVPIIAATISITYLLLSMTKNYATY